MTDYELDMDPKKIYTLVALSAYYNKVFYHLILELQVMFKSICQTWGNGIDRIALKVCGHGCEYLYQTCSKIVIRREGEMSRQKL